MTGPPVGVPQIIFNLVKPVWYAIVRGSMVRRLGQQFHRRPITERHF